MTSPYITDPNAYLDERQGGYRRPDPRPEADPVADTLRRMDEDRIRRGIIEGPKPDAIARTTRLARESGAPPAVIEDREDEVERAQNADKLGKVFGKYPAFGRWASANPRGAATAADDHESLGLLGRAWEVLAGRGQQTTQMTGKMGWGSVDYFNDIGDALAYPVEAALATVARPFGINIDPDTRRAKQRAISQGRIDATDTAIAAADARATTGNYWLDQTTSGLASLAPSLAAIGLGIATKNPGAASGFMGVTTAGASYADARTKGLGLTTATRYAATQGFTEAVTERIPAGKLVEAIAKKTPFGKTLVRQLGEELKGENIATVVQDLTDWAYLPENADKSLGDYIRARPQAALDTSLATIGGTAAQTGIAVSTDRTVRAGAKIADRIGQAAQARREAGFIDKASKAAQASKLRTRDPEAYRALIQAQAEETGATHVYVDAAALQAYYQSDSYDPDGDPFAAYEDQANEAAGGDVVIPIADALTDLVGTAGWEAIKPDLRLMAGGVSPREADTFDSEMEDVLAGLTDEMAVSEQADAGRRTALERLTDSLTTKIAGGGYATPAARTMATVLATRAQTRYERQGFELIGNEYDNLEVRQVLPDVAKPFVTRTEKGVDVSPDLINEVKAKRGPSLLEFVAKRGGISDPLDREYRGAPVYASGQQTEAANAVRAMLEQAGYDPAKMSAKDIRDVIAEFDRRDERPGYEQDLFDAENATDPAKAEAAKQRLKLRAEAPLRGENRTGKAQDGTMGLGLFDTADQPRIFEQSPGDARRWARLVDAVVRGDQIPGAMLPLGRTPAVLQSLGFPDAPLVMSKGKMAKARRDHPEVPLTVWRNLPGLISDPRAAFPSPKNDGSWVVAIEAKDGGGQPIIVPIIAAQHGENVVLSVYGRDDNYIANGITAAQKAGEQVYLSKGLADALAVKDDRAEPPRHALNAPEVPTKPARKILSRRDVVKKMEQTYGEGARARVIFDQQRAIVELFANKNLSSFFHETGHIWLEELRFDASLDGAPQQVKDDWQKVQDWFAANGHPLDNGQIPVEAHELWARGVERYLMEGKAPSSALTRIFETFRGWLTHIYHTVDALRSPITPEIRGVMDRLIATDEEIAAANERQNIAALFKDAADAAMSAQEFAAYQAQVAEARAHAHGKLLDKTMRVVRARETKRWRDERETLIAETTEAMDATPLLKSLAAMKTQPISAEWLSGEGIDPATLPVRVPPIVKPGGADPQIIAELAGFATARDMLTALQTAQAAHREAKEGGDKRSMRQRMIEVSADAEMERRYGDPLNDGSIEREALEAVHSDMQGEVIATELRVLSRKSGKRPTPYALAKDWARNRIRSGKVADEASPSAIQRYARAAAKAGREAGAAMLKQDADEAFRQKQFQMLNNALVSEAKAAEDEVNAAVKRLSDIATIKTRKSIDQDYLEQAQALLEDYDFKRRTNKELAERGRFEAWAAAQAEAGNEVYVPERLAPVGTNWKSMTVDQIVALDDTIKSILHVGRRKKELQIGKDKRDFNEARGEWLQAAEPLAERPVGDERNPERSKLRGLFSNFVRTDMMAKIMDNGDPNGLMTRVLAYGSKEADNTYYRIQKQVLEPLIEAYMAMKGDRLHNRISTPEWIDYRTGEPAVFMRSDLLAIALNLGNDSNMRKMIAGEALLFKGREDQAPTQAGIEAMLARELNEAEWKLVETAWRRVESMWPEIVADERERTGITPEKVEPRMVETPFGTIEGGYWPAVYDGDPAKAAAAGINLAEYKASDLESVLGLVGKGVATNKGHTITRTDFVAPMYLNFEGVLFGHVNQVAKRIAYQSWATNALKVIRDPRIKAMWARKLGEEYHDQLEPWLRQTINQGAVADTGHLADFNGILKQARMTLTVMGLVMRFSTMLAQIGGLTSSINAIGVRNMLNGIALCAADYGANKARIYEASPLMARRINEFDRDQAAALAEMSNPPKTALGKALKPVTDKRDRWNALGFHAIGAIQLHLVDLPTWAGAYAQATGSKDEGGLDMAHDDAVNYADLKVEQAQGAGRAAQLAAIQRAGEMSRILTLFYTFFGTQLNYQWEMTQDVRNGRYGKATKSAFWIMVATPLLGGLIADAIRGELPDEDDDDTWLAWAMRKVFFGMFNNIPIVRDFSNQAERSAAGKFAPDPQTPWQRVASGVGGGLKDGFAGISQTDWYQDAEQLMPFLPDPDEVSDKWIKHTIEALGFATGTGLGQVASTTQFAIDAANDAADPDGFADWQQGVVTGRIKEDQ